MEVLFASNLYDKYAAEQSLPKKFERLIDQMNLECTAGKWTAIKMHLGRYVGYTTIHPLFIKILVEKLKKFNAKVFITDQDIHGCLERGYTESYLGAPIIPVCGVMGKYYYTKEINYRSFTHIDIGGNIHDAEVLIDLSHVKGHGVCGYGGACKNIAMGCVTDRTRAQIHSLEGGINWKQELCTHCEQCVDSCNHYANSFDHEGIYRINYHHCTFCQHCFKVCPTGAIELDTRMDEFERFQRGMAICTDEVLKTFDKENVFYINFLTNITAICDCWGFSTPSIVPDIGIMASRDIVAIDRACLDAIKAENLIESGIPQNLDIEMLKSKSDKHLLERLHGKNPFVQLNALEEMGIGTQEYQLREI